jgi:hypothetical protein
MREKQFILGEIKRTAILNRNEPLGQTKFRTETGIAPHEWAAHWPRWGDALEEAGFARLQWTQALDEEQILDEIAKLVRKYQRYPVKNEVAIEKRGGAKVPAPSVLFRRFGGKAEIIRRLRDHCSLNEEYSDISSILANEQIKTVTEVDAFQSTTETSKSKLSGFVYLLKSGKLYKIGRSENHWRRKSELHRQTSEGITELHTISAIDDAPGIERYWHERFKDKRQHGEWFDLSADDISAFKKRKFM